MNLKLIAVQGLQLHVLHSKTYNLNIKNGVTARFRKKNIISD